jgi:hypothetical protein
MANILGRRFSLPTLSKAADRSKPITATTLDLAVAETQVACTVASAVVQERPFLKLCWEAGRMLLAFMKASRSSLAIVLSTFDMAQSMATGLYNAGSCLAFPPPLYRVYECRFEGLREDAARQRHVHQVRDGPGMYGTYSITRRCIFQGLLFITSTCNRIRAFSRYTHSSFIFFFRRLQFFKCPF